MNSISHRYVAMLKSTDDYRWKIFCLSLNGCKKIVSKKCSSVLEFAEFTSESKERIFVYWRSVQEVAHAIYAWAEKNAKIGSVETIVDICEESDSKDEIFYKMPAEIVLKACYAL